MAIYRIATIVIFLPIAFFMVSCDSSSMRNSANEADPDSNLGVTTNVRSTTWRLNSYKLFSGESTESIAEAPYRFLLEENRVVGINDCASFIGTYSIDDEKLLIQPESMDGQTCNLGTAQYSEQINLITSTFGQSLLYEHQNGELTLLTANGDRILFMAGEIQSDNEIPFVEIEKGDLGQLGELNGLGERFIVYKTKSEFDAAYAQLFVSQPSTAPNAPSVDFSTKMVIGVFMAPQPNGGSTIRVTKISIDDDLSVDVQATYPGTDCVVTDAPSSPYQFISLPVSVKNVVFNQTSLQDHSCSAG